VAKGASSRIYGQTHDRDCYSCGQSYRTRNRARVADDPLFLPSSPNKLKNESDAVCVHPHLYECAALRHLTASDVRLVAT
jgi:hypothetical protein